MNSAYRQRVCRPSVVFLSSQIAPWILPGYFSCYVSSGSIDFQILSVLWSLDSIFEHSPHLLSSVRTSFYQLIYFPTYLPCPVLLHLKCSVPLWIPVIRYTSGLLLALGCSGDTCLMTKPWGAICEREKPFLNNSTTAILRPWILTELSKVLLRHSFTFSFMA
jgi:hypothetical protein